MGFFDFLSSAQSVDPMGYGGPQAGVNPRTGASPLGDMFSDPNMLQLLAGMGSGFSQGKSAGEAIGVPTSQMITNQAMQGAAAKQNAQYQPLMQAIIQSLGSDPTGNKLLGPKEDPNTLNSISITDGGIKIDAPNPGKTPVPQTEFKSVTDKPIESVRGGQQIPFL